MPGQSSEDNHLVASDVTPHEIWQVIGAFTAPVLGLTGWVGIVVLEPGSHLVGVVALLGQPPCGVNLIS